MGDTLPQIRVRSDTQSRNLASRIDAQPTQSRGAADDGSTARPTSNTNMEGMSTSHEDWQGEVSNPHPSVLMLTPPFVARPLSNGKGYPSKFMPTMTGSQLNVTGKSVGAEGRTDLQAIDPLSHVLAQTSV